MYEVHCFEMHRCEAYSTSGVCFVSGTQCVMHIVHKCATKIQSMWIVHGV